MKLGKTVGNFFALDIGTTALRVVELAHSGSGWNLKHYGVKQIPTRLSESTAEKDRRELGMAITELIAQSGIKAKDVAIGIPSSKMFASVVEVPTVSKSELNATIKYQAENYVPMRADEAKIDWAIIGPSPVEQNKSEVLVASVLNTFTESRLDLLESELGLNVIAIEPDSIALVRSLLPDGVSDGRLIVNMEDSATDVIVTLGNAPRLIRSIPIGMKSLVRMAKQNLSIDEQQAQQLLLKFGVDPDALDGQLFRSVHTLIDQLNGELIKSLKFFTTKYNGMQISATLISGYTSILPGFANIIANKTNLATQIATPWQHVNVPMGDQTNLAPISAQFAVVVGLAERME
ncbi:MAG: type IV pilus assembly protein PilM [Candidatus Saccharibacteria bacterium]|nr:type IV pilus assembly protein PilM [Candidatus Saccharibacteria bacterium]